jgi:hypothetical protein
MALVLQGGISYCAGLVRIERPRHAPLRIIEVPHHAHSPQRRDVIARPP